MFRWMAKRPVNVHRTDGDGDRVLLKGTIVLSDTDSPMQDRINFLVETTGLQCWLASDYFVLYFERV
jgi:hypothetical protein